MVTKIPTVKQVAWISIFPQLIVLGILIFIWYQFNKQDFYLFGAGTYMILSHILKYVIPKDHRNGMRKLKTEDFENAIPDFEKSFEYFKNNNWIDKYRFLVLLSSSRITYKEMALNNIAFCYGQIGHGEKSKEYYERTLSKFPDSILAKVGLRFLNSTNKIKK